MTSAILNGIILPTMKDLEDQPMYFGAPIEDYPEPCRSCSRIAALAIALNNPDLSSLSARPFPETNSHRTVRKVIPCLNMCTEDTCGLEERFTVSE